MALSGDINEVLVFGAHDFVQRGWSVIPLWGDANLPMGKAPALPSWKVYQERLATPEELEDWFGRRGLSAMGVVLGEVSQLLVIDIDTKEQAAMFQEYCGDLLQTFTVRSGNRGLPHYYFQLGKGTVVSSRYGKGIELRGEGQYVVAPGVSMDGKVWEVVANIAPRLLTGSELRRILAYFEYTPHERQQQAKKRPSRPKQPDEISAGEISASPTETPQRTTVRGLQRKYDRQANEWGRNNGLFNTAAYARDRGWSQEEVKEILVAAHAQHPANGAHRVETLRQRQQEAERTIASVYKRAPRPVEEWDDAAPGRQLPNTVREKLLQCGLAKVARLLDGLMLAGFGPDREFTAAEAVATVARFGIGKNTVFAVLKTLWDNGKAIFKCAETPSPPDPLNPIANAANGCLRQTKQCLFGRVANPAKIRGRPPKHFVMPGITALCQLLGVKNKGSDAIKTSALQSLASYRAALHAALFKRAPGQYPRHWQAQRLGVSVDSCRRYDRRAEVKSSPVYRSWMVNWRNVAQMFPNEPVMGHFIEDNKGKRYPPLEAIARKLLGRKQAVTYKAQDANYYEVPKKKAAKIVAQKQSTGGECQMMSPAIDPWKEGARQMMQEALSPSSVTGAETREAAPQLAHQLAGDSASFKHQDSPEIVVDVVREAACAHRLYEGLRKMNAQKSLTRKAAEGCVKEYGAALVERGLKVVQQRRNIHNPAGFLRVWLRSEKKFPKQ